MSRMKKYLVLAVFLSAAIAVSIIAQKPQQQPFSVVETSIPDMQKALKEKRVTSRELVVST